MDQFLVGCMREKSQNTYNSELCEFALKNKTKLLNYISDVPGLADLNYEIKNTKFVRIKFELHLNTIRVFINLKPELYLHYQLKLATNFDLCYENVIGNKIPLNNFTIGRTKYTPADFSYQLFLIKNNNTKAILEFTIKHVTVTLTCMCLKLKFENYTKTILLNKFNRELILFAFDDLHLQICKYNVVLNN